MDFILSWFPSSAPVSKDKHDSDSATLIPENSFHADLDDHLHDDLGSMHSWGSDSSISRASTPEIWERKDEDTLIVVDWDDTLFPTSELGRLLGKNSHDSSLSSRDLNSCVLPIHVYTPMRELESQAMNLLACCMLRGETMIVTNSDPGWVEYTASLLLPRLWNWLETHQVPLVSARGLYEHRYPKNLTLWKSLVFENELSYRGGRIQSLVSIGDGEYERLAAQACIQGGWVSRIQTIRFQGESGLETLRRQVELCVKVLDLLATDGGNLDITLKV
jgi:hypothetical protein